MFLRFKKFIAASLVITMVLTSSGMTTLASAPLATASVVVDENSSEGGSPEGTITTLGEAPEDTTTSLGTNTASPSNSVEEDPATPSETESEDSVEESTESIETGETEEEFKKEFIEISTVSNIAPLATISDADEERYHTGYIPESFTIDLPEPKKVSKFFEDTPIPSSYDSRTIKNPANESMSIVPPIRDQGGHNTCWAFSTYGLVETNLRKKGLVTTEEESNLSELGLAYFVYNLENITNNNSYLDYPGLEGHDYSKVIAQGEDFETLGGNVASAAAVLSSFVGPLREDQDESLEYKPLKGAKFNVPLDGNFAFKNNAYQLKNCIFLNKNDVNGVKRAIMDYGAVGISFYGDGSALSASGFDTVINEEHYHFPNGDSGQNQPRSANHAIIIVGWDDNIPASNFKNTSTTNPGQATHNGGWLCKNSWGNYPNANDGFFWMSYDEPSIYPNMYAIEMMEADTYKFNYHYDTTCYVGGIGPFGSNVYSYGLQSTFANTFQAKGNETLDAISLMLFSNNSVFDILVYTSDSPMTLPQDGTLRLRQTNVTKTHAGVYTIELENKVVLDANTYYSIIIAGRDADSHNFMMGFDCNQNDGSVQYVNETQTGQSVFGYADIDTENYMWDDEGFGVGDYNWRIKGLTNPVSAAPAPAEGYYVFGKDWFSGSTPGIPITTVESITFLQCTESVPTGTDVIEWDLPASSHGLKGYTRGNNIYIYAPADAPIKMPEDSSYLFSSETGSSFFGLEEIVNLNYLDTSDVTNMDSMFNFDRQLGTLDLSNFNTSNVTNMHRMFAACNNMSSIDLSSFDTSSVTDMSGMFTNCNFLVDLNVSSFDTRNVTTMADMFYECRSLEELNLNNFRTPRLTNMDRMFYVMSSNSSYLKVLSMRYFDTSNVTSMNQTFYKLSSLKSLDLRSFDTKNVTNMNNLFNGCSALERIYASENFKTTGITNNSINWSGIFSNCTSLKGGNGTTWTSSLENSKDYARIDSSSTPGFFTANPTYDYVMSPNWFSNLSSVPSSFTLGLWDIERIELRVYDLDFNPADQGYTKVGDIDGSSLNVYGKRLELYYNQLYDLNTGFYDKLVIYAPKVDDSEDRVVGIRAADDSSYLFSGNMTKVNYTDNAHLTDRDVMLEMPMGSGTLDSLVSIRGLNRLNTENVTDMQGMFYFCHNLNDIDLSSFDTSNVTDMSLMFMGALNDVDYLNLSNFNTSKVKSFNQMFSEIGAKEINVSSFDTSSALNFAGMFSNFGSGSLQKLDISNFDVSNAVTLTHMISSQKLDTVDVTNFDTSNVHSFEGLFYGMNQLTEIDVSSFDTSSATDMRWMFNDCPNLVTIKASTNFVAQGITENMFDLDTSLVGGKGTTYSDSNPKDGTYARIDQGPTSSAPGYFTDANQGAVYITFDFDMNGHGTQISSKNVEAGKKLSKPADPTAEGYTFKHWYETDPNTAFDFTQTIPATSASPRTLYAKWEEKSYTITLNDNGGTYVSTYTKPTSRKYTDTTTLPTGSDISKTGYTFGGWYDNGGFTGTAVTSITANTEGPHTYYLKWEENSYDIVLNADGGTYASGYTKPTSKKYTDTATLPTSADIKKTGYVFKGWYDNSGFTGSVKTTVPANVVGPYEYWLKWNKLHTVTFDLKKYDTTGTGTDIGATPAIDSQSIEDGTKATKPTTDPTAAGHRFEGWYHYDTTTHTYGSEFNFATETITADTTIYAKWYEIQTITVDFNMNGHGTQVATQYVVEDTKVTKPTDPTATGYTFKYWYETDPNTAFDFTQTIPATSASPRTLYAKWEEKSYTITLNDNGGTYATTYTKPTNRKYTDTTTLPIGSDISKTGYTFGGWYDNGGFTGTAVTSITANTEGPHTYYLKWEENSYDIVLNADGGTYASGYTKPTSRKYTDATTLPTSADISKTGYTFDGWYDNSGFTGSKITSIPANTVGPHTYYLKWNVDSYSITLNDDGGTYDSTYTKPTSRNYTDVTTLPTSADISKTGYTFGGWYDNSGFTGSAVTEIAANSVGPHTYWLKWDEDEYTITLNDNGGTYESTYTKPVSKKYTATVTLPTSADISKTGYVFKGWYDNSGFTGSVKTTAPANVVGPYEYWLKWNKLHTVTFDLKKYNETTGASTDIGATSVSSQDIEDGTKATKPTTDPTAAGHRFEGWYHYNTTTHTYGSEFNFATETITADTTIYAKWYEIQTITVDFNMNGHGTQVATQYVVEDTKVIKPTDPTAEGWTFKYWYESDPNTAFDFTQTIPATSASPRTLYAKWEENTYTITLHDDGGTYDTTYTKPASRKYTDTTTLPTSANIAKTGYNFIGWYDNSGKTGTVVTEISANTTGPHEYWLKWEEATYNITLNDNGGTYESTYTKPTSKKYTDTATLPTSADIKKTGYVFKGWYDNSGFTGSVKTTAPANVVGPYEYWLKWNKLHTVTFDLKKYDETTGASTDIGATAVSSQDIEDGTKATKPTTDPTAAGHRFEGWYHYNTTTHTYGSEFNFATETITADTTIYAKWYEIQTITVDFNMNGHGTQVATQYVPEDTKATKPANPTATGYTFKYWYETDPNTEFNFDHILPLSAGATRTLHAKWEENIYTITLNDNSGTYASGYTKPTSRKYTDLTTLPTSANITKAGHNFIGWYDNSGFTGTPVTTIPANTVGPHTYWLKWEGIGYNVTLYSLGGSKSGAAPATPSEVLPYTAGAGLDLPMDYERDGQNVILWYDGYDEATDTYNGNRYTRLDASAYGDKSLYARYGKEFTITYDANGGTGSMSVRKVYDFEDVVLDANTFTRNNYTFDGWDGSDNNRYTDKQSIGKLTGDLTLKARWKSSGSERVPSGGNNRGSSNSSSSTGPAPNTTPGPTQNQSQAKSAAQTLSEGNVAKTTMSSGSVHIESIVKNTEAWRYDPISNKWQITGLGMAGQVVMASNTFCQVSKTYTMNVNGVDTQVDVQDTYYFDEKGSMVTGWLQSSDGKLYFFEDAKTADEGKMALGWKKVAGIWYYFSSNGTLLTNAVTPDGYIVGPYGEIIN